MDIKKLTVNAIKLITNIRQQKLKIIIWNKSYAIAIISELNSLNVNVIIPTFTIHHFSKKIVIELYSISLVTNEVEYFSSGVHLKKFMITF